jgi:transcription elongation factor Elf1
MSHKAKVNIKEHESIVVCNECGVVYDLDYTRGQFKGTNRWWQRNLGMRESKLKDFKCKVCGHTNGVHRKRVMFVDVA